MTRRSLGEDFCSAPWQQSTAILDFNLTNCSRTKENAIPGDYCNLACTLAANSEGCLIVGDYVFMNARCQTRCDHLEFVESSCIFGPEVVLWNKKNHPMSVVESGQQAVQIETRRVGSYEVMGVHLC